MCVVKTPKVTQSSTTTKTPDPAIIRNPYLDGLDPVSKALRTGRSSLRIERAGSGAASVAPPATAPAPLASAPAVDPTSGLPRMSAVPAGGAVAGARISRSRVAQ